MTGWLDTWLPYRVRTYLGRSYRFRIATAILCSWLVAALAGAWWGQAGEPVQETLLGAWTAARVVGGVLLVAVPLGWTVGLVAGAGPRLVDTLLARLIEVGGLLPTVVLLAVVQAAEPVPTLSSFVVVVIVTRALRLARLVRGEALRVSHATHVMAARAVGVSRRRVLALHVSPLTIGPLLVEVAFTAAAVVALEAGLSLIGLGLPDNSSSWGSQLSGHSGLSAALPAAAIVLVTAALVLLADALDDAWNPRRSVRPPRAQPLPAPEPTVQSSENP
jgi:peptide/nickel transport system permease protein